MKSPIDMLNFALRVDEDPSSVHKETVETVRKADCLLAAPFDFYNFNVRLNIEDQMEIQNQNYVRYYKHKIETLLEEADIKKHEYEVARSLIEEFRNNTEKATKLTNKFQLQSAIHKEEKDLNRAKMDKKFQFVVDGFTKQFKKLDEESK